MRHHVRRCDGEVEVEGAATGDLLGELLATDHVGSRLLGLLRLLTVGEHQDADLFARAVRQAHRAANQLIGLAGVDAEREHRIDALVEGGMGERLHEIDRVLGPVQGLLVEAAQRVCVRL